MLNHVFVLSFACSHANIKIQIPEENLPDHDWRDSKRRPNNIFNNIFHEKIGQVNVNNHK